MSTAPAKPEKAAKPVIPPEDSFWQRYSPHHEAPLSGISSLAVHLLAIPLILLVGWLLVKLGLGEDTKPLPVDVVSMLGGGGGSRRGSGTGGSDPGTEHQQGSERGHERDPAERQPEEPERPRLDPARVNEAIADFGDDPAAERLFQQATNATAALSNLPSAVRKDLRKSVNPGAGQGGSGSGGGKDTGKDKGTGAGTGPGKASLNQREKRVLRWAMTFNTRNGGDYARQLHGLGAIIAVPLDDGKRFEVIRDLSQKPVQAKEEDIGSINRIFWVDDKPDSVYSLIHNGLGMQRVPRFFVAFFPPELEEDLLKKEQAYMERKGRRWNEDDIHETRFNVRQDGGKYSVEVAGQQYR